MTVPNSKPTINKSNLRIVACASPADGHTQPIVKICEDLVKRGFDVTLLAGAQYEPLVTRASARFSLLKHYGHPRPPQEYFGEIFGYLSSLKGTERTVAAMRHLFVEPMPGRSEELSDALAVVKAESPDAEVIVLTETLFAGHLPLYYGGRLPAGFTRRPRILNISAVTYSAASRDTPPFGPAVVPVDSDEARAEYAAMYEAEINGVFRETIARQHELIIKEGGKNVPNVHPIDVMILGADKVLQMCPPSLEFKRSDLPAHVQFAGATPAPGGPKPGFEAPAFWDEVTRGDKKVVVVTQGTVAMNYSQLLIPTIKCLADRPDVLVVAILGVKGVSLPEDVEVPANARVIDYLSYDAVLPYASVFINNAGYGGFIHGIVNGVPMVLAGDSEDKPEVAVRGEYSGVGINLRTATPTEEKLRAAIYELLDNDKYTKRVKEVQRENAEMKAFDTIERSILELVATE